MRDIAENIRFEIVYGDTDSLFLHNRDYGSSGTTSSRDIISRFQEECYNQLGIEVEHAKTYQTAIISDKKKHSVSSTEYRVLIFFHYVSICIQDTTLHLPR
jgi:DNA polymerase elongation subunit (family B)